MARPYTSLPQGAQPGDPCNKVASRSTSLVAAAFCSGAVPWVRRMPAHLIRTAGSIVGFGCRAAWSASEMAARRRRKVWRGPRWSR